MRVLGIGVDIVEVARFRDLQRDSGVVTKFLTEEEVDEVFQRKEPGPTLAGRFAAKEAIIKAVRAGSPCTSIFFKDIVVGHDEKGAPTVRVYGDDAGNFQILLSISHGKEQAIAFAMAVERCEADE